MEIRRVFDLLAHQLENFPQDDALAAKVSGEWKKWSTQDFYDESLLVARGLIELGIGRGDRVAIISPNRPEWLIADFGIQHAGAVSVPMYPTITPEDYRFIFGDSGAKIVFVGTKELFDKATEGIKGLANPPAIYTFDQVMGALHWSEVMKIGHAVNPKEIDAIKAAVTPQDLYTIMYTSGTTGVPKGVMLTHDNLVKNVEGSMPAMPFNENHRALSFLPLSHVYERMVSGIYIRFGVSIYYAESLETIGDNLKEVQPHVFTTVPRLLEKVYDKIVAKGYTLTGIKKQLFFWALNLGLKYEVGKPMGLAYDMQLALANNLIFSKWREALGGNVMAVVSGSAALQPRLARVFRAARIAVMEGYGLTETSPVISVNRMEDEGCRVGSVGPLIGNVEVKLAEDGEILTKGPCVFKGYWNRPDLTAESIDTDGWFHTGDVGTWEEGRFLKITDRKKELFKTSGGKYVAPQMIENKLKESLVIEQVMVVGEGQKHPAAIIVPDFAALKSWCQRKGIAYTTNAEMVKLPEIRKKFQEDVDNLNEHLAQWERVKKFALLPEAWTIEKGEITPSLKLRRKVVLEHCRQQMEELYS